MQITITTVPSGFMKPNESDNLRLAVVFTFRQGKDDKSYDQLTPQERDVLDDWPKVLKQIISAGFTVHIRKDDDPASFHTWDLAADSVDSKASSAAWKVFRPKNPFCYTGQTLDPRTANTFSGPASQPPRAVISYPAWSIRETLRRYYTDALVKSIRSLDTSGKQTPGWSVKPKAINIGALNIFANDIANNLVAGTIPVRGSSGPAGMEAGMPPSDVEFIRSRNLCRLGNPDNLQKWVHDFVNDNAKVSFIRSRGEGATDADAQDDFLRLAIFHNRVPTPAVPPVPHTKNGSESIAAATTTSTGDLDFFQQIAMVWNYPALLQPLGLVVILNVGLETTDRTVLDDCNRICVIPKSGLVKSMVPLWTRYAVSATHRFYFQAADQKSGAVSRGYLELKSLLTDGSPRFRIDNLDIDGTGLKVLNMASHTTRQEGAVIYTRGSDPYGAVIQANATAQVFLGAGTLAQRLRKRLAPGVETYSAADITNLETIKAKVASASTTDPVYNFLTDKFNNTVALLNKADGNGDSSELIQTLVSDLNKLFSGPPFYSAAQFPGVPLRVETQNLLRDGQISGRLIRLLLEDMLDLSMNPDLKLFTPEELKLSAWKTLTFQSDLLLLPQPSETKLPGMGLSATAVRGKDGSLDKVRWQLFGGSGYDDGTKELHPPAPRTAGVGLIWRGRDEHLINTQKRAQKLKETLSVRALDDPTSADPADDLFANDLVLGYIPVVCNDQDFRNPDNWHSLTKRHEVFSGALAGIEPENPDGVIRLPAMQTLDAGVGQPQRRSPDIMASELVMNWNGRTLGIPDDKCATLLRDEQSKLQRDDPDTPTEHETFIKHLDRWQLPVTVSMPKGTRVPLQFCTDGKLKYFRVKTCDIAGLQPSRFDIWDNDPENNLSFQYHRHEPVIPPEVLLDQPLIERIPGRGLLRMVVNSDETRDTRWCVPPRTSFEMAEKYGLLTMQSLKEFVGFDEMDLRPDGSLPVVSPSDTTSKSSWSLPVRKTRQVGNVGKVPYLPDPLSRMMVVRLVYWMSNPKDALPQMQSKVTKIPFYSDGHEWPKAHTIRVTLFAGDDEEPSLQVVSASHVIEVHLPHGTTADLHLCSGLGEDEQATAYLGSLSAIEDLRNQGLSPDDESLDPQKKDSLSDLQYLRNSFVALLRPWRTIECVHTSKLPVRPPRIVGLVRNEVQPDRLYDFSRRVGAPTAEFTLNFHADAQSTASVRLHAEWTYPIDGRNKSQSRTADLGEMAVEHDLGGRDVPLLPFPVTHVFPDTAYRAVKYTAIGETRFRGDYVRLLASDGQVMSQSITVDMLNCARPPAPLFDYIVPTEKREHSNDDKYFTSKRTGGGIRVWLKKPWYVTGDGERLGVVIFESLPTDVNPPSEEDVSTRRRLTTQWGLDPTSCLRKQFCAPPVVEDFVEQKEIGRNIPLKEFDNRPVSIVAYEPSFSTERDQWYADVVLDPVPAEYCFIQMALVRYQSKSILQPQDLRISSVVKADFAQLVPDRTVIVYRDATDARTLTLRVDIKTETIRTAGSPPSGKAAPNILYRIIEVNVFKQTGDASWIVDNDIVVEADQNSNELDDPLWSGKVRWPKRLGPRRLMVREKELTIQPAVEQDPERKEVPFVEGRILYMDVLDL